MKYHCSTCGDMCFDGSTEKSLPKDIKSHESGSFHKHNLEEKKDDKFKKITETAHKMKSGEIPTAVSYDSIEEFTNALKDKA